MADKWRTNDGNGGVSVKAWWRYGDVLGSLGCSWKALGFPGGIEAPRDFHLGAGVSADMGCSWRALGFSVALTARQDYPSALSLGPLPPPLPHTLRTLYQPSEPQTSNIPSPFCNHIGLECLECIAYHVLSSAVSPWWVRPNLIRARLAPSARLRPH